MPGDETDLKTNLETEGGGGPVQLGYAAITSSFTQANASAAVPVPGLSITATIVTGRLYCMEFYSIALDEDSGSTAGERLVVKLLCDGAAIGQATNVNDVGGFGDATYCRTGTLTGDGASHVYTATVINTTTGADGVIVQAQPESPAYIRLLRLS